LPPLQGWSQVAVDVVAQKYFRKDGLHLRTYAPRGRPAGHMDVLGLDGRLLRARGGDAVSGLDYADKRGKYQDQKGLTLPFVVGWNGSIKGARRHGYTEAGEVSSIE
jgi:hypothetical protein